MSEFRWQITPPTLSQPARFMAVFLFPCKIGKLQSTHRRRRDGRCPSWPFDVSITAGRLRVRKREILIDDGGERRVLNLFYKGNKNVINFTSVRRARAVNIWQCFGRRRGFPFFATRRKAGRSGLLLCASVWFLCRLQSNVRFIAREGILRNGRIIILSDIGVNDCAMEEEECADLEKKGFAEAI